VLQRIRPSRPCRNQRLLYLLLVMYRFSLVWDQWMREKWHSEKKTITPLSFLMNRHSKCKAREQMAHSAAWNINTMEFLITTRPRSKSLKNQCVTFVTKWWKVSTEPFSLTVKPLQVRLIRWPAPTWWTKRHEVWSQEWWATSLNR